MRNVITAIIMTSTLAINTSIQAAENAISNWLSEDGKMQCDGQSNMFDGIKLTEQQHQKLRDLMQKIYHSKEYISISEKEKMYRLITAEDFDENAVRDQINKVARQQVACQVEIAKVRSYMYHQLTPEQQAVINEKHQQRMDKLRKVVRMQRDSATVLSGNNDNIVQPYQ